MLNVFGTVTCNESTRFVTTLALRAKFRRGRCFVNSPAGWRVTLGQQLIHSYQSSNDHHDICWFEIVILYALQVSLVPVLNGPTPIQFKLTREGLQSFLCFMQTRAYQRSRSECMRAGALKNAAWKAWHDWFCPYEMSKREATQTANGHYKRSTQHKALRVCMYSPPPLFLSVVIG